LRSETGDESVLPVSIVGWDENLLHVQAAPGALHESLSGSVVYINNQRVAMLVTIATDVSRPSQAIRFDRIGTLTKQYLLLEPPTAERARLDDQVALEQLRANLNFVETPLFCDSLYRAARWTYERKPALKIRERRTGIDRNFVNTIDSLVIPATDSEMSSSDKQTEIATVIARLPSSLDVKPTWDRAVRAINGCIHGSALSKERNLRFRQGQHELSTVPGVTMWSVDYTNNWGMSMDIINIWLDIDTSSSLRLRVYRRN